MAFLKGKIVCVTVFGAFVYGFKRFSPGSFSQVSGTENGKSIQGCMFFYG